MMNEKNLPAELEKLPFEETLAQLEALVGKMETGRLPLEELMGDFEKGSLLVKVCRRKLDALEKKIELLTRDDGGSGEWQDFSEEAAANRATQTAHAESAPAPVPAPAPAPAAPSVSDDLPF